MAKKVIWDVNQRTQVVVGEDDEVVVGPTAVEERFRHTGSEDTVKKAEAPEPTVIHKAKAVPSGSEKK